MSEIPIHSTIDAGERGKFKTAVDLEDWPQPNCPVSSKVDRSVSRSVERRASKERSTTHKLFNCTDLHISFLRHKHSHKCSPVRNHSCCPTIGDEKLAEPAETDEPETKEHSDSHPETRSNRTNS